jgi:ParB family chromosome partitioning protein
LFRAREAGASKTRIRKATGLSKDQVTAGLAAGELTGQARQTAEQLGYAVTLDQLALLAEFDDDPAAIGRITTALCGGSNGEHVAEQIRRERAEAAAQQQLTADLETAGYQVSQTLPEGACLLTFLLHNGEDLTAETHAACPGRGALFRSYDPLTPVHYCTDPEANDHTHRYQDTPAPDLGSSNSETTASEPGPRSDPGRRLIVEGNRAWTTACTVRTRWLADHLLQRRTAPREVMAFATSQIVTMPWALRDALTRAPSSELFRELTGGRPSAQEISSSPAGRLPLLLLAAIATAYESLMSGDSGKPTWRTDRYSACPRAEAGEYLRFLSSIGYELSDIEQAVADGVPYAGIQPDNTGIASPANHDEIAPAA